MCCFFICRIRITEFDRQGCNENLFMSSSQLQDTKYCISYMQRVNYYDQNSFVKSSEMALELVVLTHFYPCLWKVACKEQDNILRVGWSLSFNLHLQLPKKWNFFPQICSIDLLRIIKSCSFESGSQCHYELWVTSSEMLDSSSLTCFLLLLAELSGCTLDWLMLSPCLRLPMGSVSSWSLPLCSALGNSSHGWGHGPSEAYIWLQLAFPAAWQTWEGQPAPWQVLGSTSMGGIQSAWVFIPVSLANPSSKIIFSLVYWTFLKSGVN